MGLDITLHSLALEEYQSWHGVGCYAFTAVCYRPTQAS